jgi:hypothetical protein
MGGGHGVSALPPNVLLTHFRAPCGANELNFNSAHLLTFNPPIWIIMAKNRLKVQN